MKGIVGDLGEMNIPLKPDANPIKKRSCRLNPRYKEKVKEKLDRMLDARISELMEESKWTIQMFVEDKKIGEVRICFNLR